MTDFAAARARMVDVQIARRGIRDAAVLDAMRTVPRERFVPKALAEFAYEDTPLPIGAEQTISQPFIVAAMIEAAMIEAAEIGRQDRGLEVGAGSGYAAAVLGQVANQVFAVERHAQLGTAAAARIEALGYDSVRIESGDGSGGLPAEAPFDAILVSAGGPDVPHALKQQLAVAGT